MRELIKNPSDVQMLTRSPSDAPSPTPSMSFLSFLQTHRLDQFLDRMVEYGADSLEDWIQYTPEEFEEAAQQIKMAGGHATRLRKALDERTI